MSDKVTIELPEELARRARAAAAARHRPLEEAVVEWIGRALAEPEAKGLSDEELLRLCDSTLEPGEQQEMSGLLAESREGRLDATGRSRLDALVSLYRRGLVLKARAWEEAVSRGLRRPLGAILSTTILIMSREGIPAELDRRIRQAARNRCGYCLSPQRLVMARLEIEHIIPVAKGGDNSESNLWLSCPLCNRFESDRTSARDSITRVVVPLFNPRTERWYDHFRWSNDGIRVLGLTPTGRATVALLHLADDPDALIVRMHWVLAGWHPPREVGDS